MNRLKTMIAVTVCLVGVSITSSYADSYVWVGQNHVFSTTAGVKPLGLVENLECFYHNGVWEIEVKFADDINYWISTVADCGDSEQSFNRLYSSLLFARSNSIPVQYVRTTSTSTHFFGTKY